MFSLNYVKLGGTRICLEGLKFLMLQRKGGSSQLVQVKVLSCIIVALASQPLKVLMRCF